MTDRADAGRGAAQVAVECPRCGGDILFASVPYGEDAGTWLEPVAGGDCDCDLSEEELDDLESEAWELMMERAGGDDE